MSRIKEFYHDEICRGLGKIEDDEYFYLKHIEETESEEKKTEDSDCKDNTAEND